MCNHRNMSRSKHQTLKSVMNGQSTGQITAMFAKRDHDAMEWVEKGAIKRHTLRGRRDGRKAPADADGHVAAPDDRRS
jgi:hypothetical protein